MTNLDLGFPSPSDPEHKISGRARELAEKSGIYLGTSSWRYDGWRGLVYNDHYSSKKKFHDLCLREYGRYFPSVGVDATFYKFPTEKYLESLIATTPEQFKFGLKVTEEISVVKWPTHKRYGQRGGSDNPNFLNAELFTERFLDPVRKLDHKLGPVMLQFPTLPKEIVDDGTFLDRLDQFLAALPHGYQISTEIRNRALFGPPYFDILKKYNVAHVYNSWSYMQPVGDQLANEAAKTSDFFTMRLLTPHQVSYKEAVETYFPYKQILHPQDGVRVSVLKFLRHALEGVKQGYVFVNNRLEGSSPLTIEHILGEILGPNGGE